ncbi:hypothetical protein BGX27_006836 [Mortierella sp. AM989]|nr:hypothetical protein BGX27_006836 [Mortierella sp. AM989]
MDSSRRGEEGRILYGPSENAKASKLPVVYISSADPVSTKDIYTSNVAPNLTAGFSISDSASMRPARTNNYHIAEIVEQFDQLNSEDEADECEYQEYKRARKLKKQQKKDQKELKAKENMEKKAKKRALKEENENADPSMSKDITQRPGEGKNVMVVKDSDLGLNGELTGGQEQERAQERERQEQCRAEQSVLEGDYQNTQMYQATLSPSSLPSSHLSSPPHSPLTTSGLATVPKPYNQGEGEDGEGTKKEEGGGGGANRPEEGDTTHSKTITSTKPSYWHRVWSKLKRSPIAQSRCKT